MERLERFYRIHHLMRAKKCLPLSDLMEDLGVSKATLKRDIEYLRDRLNAPLIFDRDREGYRYDLSIEGADRYDLPGVWFSPREIHALVVVHSLLSDISPTLLAGSVSPLITRIEKLLENHQIPPSEVARRIRILNVANRESLPEHFATAAQAVLQRKRLALRHHKRSEDKVTTREVSPQRLIHYRGSWYLDAWCHLRTDLRSFALDAVEEITLLDSEAENIEDQRLQDFFASAYGIFTGAVQHMAVLRFSPERARWVRKERWHPQQVGCDEPDGHYQLQVPYGKDTELVMDILRHGAEVEVLSPPALRSKVADEANRMIRQYAGSTR